VRNEYKILDEKPDGKRPVDRPMQIWEDNIKMYHKKTRCEYVD
jgi:hypothetical protein